MSDTAVAHFHFLSEHGESKVQPNHSLADCTLRKRPTSKKDCGNIEAFTRELTMIFFIFVAPAFHFLKKKKKRRVSLVTANHWKVNEMTNCPVLN